MSNDLPVMYLRTERRTSHPWIFRNMVEKPEVKPPPGTVVDVLDRAGTFCGRGFYNGRSTIAIRVLTSDREVAIDESFFFDRIRDAVELRRGILRLDEVTDAWRVVHAEGDGLSGLIVDRFGDLLVLEYHSAGPWKYRKEIRAALERCFPGCRLHEQADGEIQGLEGFAVPPRPLPEPVVVTEHGVRYRAAPGSAHKTGFFADQRDNRRRVASWSAGRKVLDLCCNTGGFSLAAAVAGAREVVGVDLDEAVIGIAKENAKLNAAAKVRFVQADLFHWLRDSVIGPGERFDVVVLDPAKMTRDREEVPMALKKYLDMNRLALQAVRAGGMFATFSCTGLVDEATFLDTVKRAAWQAGRTVQVVHVDGAGPDHPWMAHVPESRYLKAVFCRVVS
jgi:23S rRNA (cytosine1962-C5)-methyltransferase